MSGPAQKIDTCSSRRTIDDDILGVEEMNVPIEVEMEVEDGQEDEENEVVSKAKETKEVSKVWKHMTPIKDKNGMRVKACCNYCKRILSAKASSGTTHLRRHTKTCSSKKTVDLKAIYLKVDRGSNGSSIVRNSVFDMNELRTLITQMIIGSKLPFSFAENPLFRSVLKVACPGYVPISRHTVRRDAMKLYKEEMIRVKKELASAPGRVSLTTDNWHNEIMKDEFICITAHWVDSAWKLQKRIITFKALTPPYDGLSIADEIVLNLVHWNIDKKIMSISLDNASYNDRLVKELKVQLKKNDKLFHDGEFFHVRCCCHILNLIVQAGLKVIDGVVDRIRGAFNHLNRSTSKQHAFFDLASKKFCITDSNIKKKLRADMPIRWNSTYIMLERALDFKEVLMYWGERNHDFKEYMLSEEEWERVAYIRQFLKIFYDATLKWSGSKYSTSNEYFDGVRKIQKHLMDRAIDAPSYMTLMISEMQKKFDKYWISYNLLLSCCCVLDPRCKMIFIDYSYDEIYGCDGHYYATRVRGALQRMFNEYKWKNNATTVTIGLISDDDDSLGCEPCVGDEKFYQYCKNKFKPSERSELDLYLDEPQHDPRVKLDIFEYWKTASNRYPILAILARDLLAIPVSTIALESAFSLGKKVISPTRGSLTPHIVETVICYEDWMRANCLHEGALGILGDHLEEPPSIVDEIEEDDKSITIVIDSS